jgi:ferredoxin
MKLKELYEKIDEIGCMTFSTIGENGEVQSRIAHFNGYDEDGLYFRTMTSKPYYRQLMKNKKLTVCGMTDSRVLSHLPDGTPVFPTSYSLRIVGEIKNVPYEVICEKAAKTEALKTAVQDGVKYQTMKDANFVMYKGKVEIYDTDFEKVTRDNKLERTRFSFGGAQYNVAGPTITDKCIGCGKCKKICTFNAIEKGNPYKINPFNCDDCGSCMLVCPVGAIEQSKEF